MYAGCVCSPLIGVIQVLERIVTVDSGMRVNVVYLASA